MTGEVELEVGAADAACLDDLARLHALCFEHAWSASEYGRLVAMPGAFSLFARVGTDAVGFLLGRVAGEEAEILSIGVAPPHRRCGIGAQLLAGADDHLRGCGALSLFIEVDQDDGAAVGFYLKHGFEQVGLRPGYYRRPDGSVSDAAVMRRPLTCA